MQTANCSTDNRRSSRTWKITAHFSPSVHVPIYDSSLQYSQQYIRDFLKSRLQQVEVVQHMQKTENNMHSITFLSFAYPRHFRGNAEVPVIVFMHFSKLVGFPSRTPRALLPVPGQHAPGQRAAPVFPSVLMPLSSPLLFPLPPLPPLLLSPIPPLPTPSPRSPPLPTFSLPCSIPSPGPLHLTPAPPLPLFLPLPLPSPSLPSP